MTHERKSYDVSPDESVSQTVIYAVADANGVDPLDLDERLYDRVDPDALDRLFEPSTASMGAQVEFEMCGCTVEVTADHTVSVSRNADGPSRMTAHV